jgi:exopolysaccharide biosynthesis operon protein EpsL
MLTSKPRNRVTGNQGGALRRRHLAAVLLALGGAAGPAWADLSDTFHPFAAVQYSYDSNLLRLSDSAQGDLSDRSRATIVGLSFDRKLGLQDFTGSAKVTHVRFDRFDELNYNGKDLAFDWNWRVGAHLDGHLGGTYVESLNSFNDFHTSQRNLRTQRGEYGEARWTFHPSWRVRGRVARDKFDYDLPSQRVLNRTEDVELVGLDYLAASGNTIGLQASERKGKYDQPRRVGNVLLEEGYTQRDLRLKVLWNLNGVTQLQFLGGRAKREHDMGSLRDASGTNGRVDVTWQPTGTVRLTASAWREFTPFEGSVASYSLNKGVGANARWAISSKIDATAGYNRVRRDFEGQQVLGVPLDSSDSARSANLGLNYSPARFVTLSANLFREKRTAARFITTGYSANGGSLSANLQF